MYHIKVANLYRINLYIVPYSYSLYDVYQKLKHLLSFLTIRVTLYMHLINKWHQLPISITITTIYYPVLVSSMIIMNG